MNKKKIIYSILTEIDKGELELKAKDYELSEEEFVDILVIMQEENLIKGVTFARAKGKPKIPFLNTAKIAMKGIEYLEENSALGKAYKGLKEIREWLPL